MDRLPISVCMISGAEAGRIGRALKSVAGWASEVIVVLNEEVRDGTDAVCASHGAKVFREPWKGFVAQRNSAAAKASQPWILSIDADEEATPELRSEIEAMLADGRQADRYAAFKFPRCTYYCGRWIRHGDWYPDHVHRLWRRGAAVWGGPGIHERIEVSGGVGRLHADLLHYSNESINRQIEKIAPFGDAFVRHCLESGRRATWFDLLIRPAWRFIRCYFLRLGFLDGWPGYYIAWMAAFSTVTRYVKIREAGLKPGQ